MKILQIASQIPVPPIDGGKLSVYGVTKSLHKRGHTIDFVCYRKHDDHKKSYILLEKICTPYILDVQTDNNLIYAAINLFSPIPYNASKYYKNELIVFLKSYFLKNSPDIVHIDHLFLGWVVDFIRDFTHVPIVLRAQNLEMNIMKRYSDSQNNFFLKLFSKIQFNKFKKYEPMICEKFDLCIMISGVDRKILLNLRPQINAISLPAGVDSSLLKISKEEIIPYSLVHIGHTDWYPNYDGLSWFISEILPQLIKKIPQIKLYVYGGGSTINFSVPSNLKKYVNVIGFVDNLWEELKNKALAIVPLRIGSGIRLKILELLATGTNILTTSIGKEGIDVRDGEELLIADTKEELCEKIISYFNNKYDRDKMVYNGKCLIKDNYTWEVISEKLEGIYMDLLNSKT